MKDTPRTNAVVEKYDFPWSREMELLVRHAEQLERELAAARAEEKRMREALEYIAKGYSGQPGNCEGHSGTHCAEVAAKALRGGPVGGTGTLTVTGVVPNDAEDAARYRWLRQHEAVSIEGRNSDWTGGVYPEDFDKFVDEQRVQP